MINPNVCAYAYVCVCVFLFHCVDTFIRIHITFAPILNRIECSVKTWRMSDQYIDVCGTRKWGKIQQNWWIPKSKSKSMCGFTKIGLRVHPTGISFEWFYFIHTSSTLTRVERRKKNERTAFAAVAIAFETYHIISCLYVSINSSFYHFEFCTGTFCWKNLYSCLFHLLRS